MFRIIIAYLLFLTSECFLLEKVGCPICGGLFSNRAKFLDHVRRQDTGKAVKMQFPCPTCGKAFSVERILRDHMRSHVNQYQVGTIVFLPTMCRSSVLSNNVLFQCPACDMTCPTPSILATHMRYRHTTERPLACQVSPGLDAVLFYFSSVL